MTEKEVKFCNKCNMSCENKQGEMDGLIDAEACGGYSSAAFEDGDVYKFSLCERCLLDIFATFKNSAKIGNYMFPEDEQCWVGEEFDRRSYFPIGTKLWEDFGETDQDRLKLDPNLDLRVVPKNVLLNWRNELEKNNNLSLKQKNLLNRLRFTKLS